MSSTTTTTTAASAGALHPASLRAGWPAWRGAFVRALPLVTIYVALVLAKDVPLWAPGVSVQGDLVPMVLSEIACGLFLAAGVALVETRAWTQRAQVAGYVLAAVVATVGMLGVVDSVIDRLAEAPAKWPLWVRFWGNAGPTFVHSLFAIALYRMWRRTRERAAALRDMQRTRVELLRQTAQADLLAMQARIDPSFLFDTLQAIGRAYGVDAAGGRRLTDALIDYLRAVLPGLDSAASTLGKECDVARAYLDLARERHALDLDVSVAPDSERNAPFPPMLVLPIVDDIARSLRSHPHPSRVLLRASANGADATLAIAVDPPYSPSCDMLATVQRRLAGLSAGRVAVSDSTITLEVPHALPARADR
jgi:hypothetical protein